jgi:hypothetical protein
LRAASLPSGLGARALAAALSLTAAAPVGAAVRLEISGDARLEGRALLLSVGLRNVGDVAATGLSVEAELAGRRARAEAGRLEPGASRNFDLRYVSDLERPGVYAVPLSLEYRESEDTSAPVRNELGYLLVPLGGRPVPALRVRVGTARIDELGHVPVALESADGAAHRARLSLRAPRGLNVLDPPVEVDVPAGGRASARIRVIRAGASHGSQVGVLAVAGVLDGPLQRDAVAGGTVTLRTSEPWLPPLRLPLLAVATVLICVAALIEWRRRRVAGAA